MRVAASLIRELRSGLTSEAVREAMQAVAEEHGCELSDDAIVSHGAQSAIGHDSGSGEIGAGEPVVVDIWPRDKASRCFADMTRTFVAGGGEPPAELAEFWKLTRDSLERVYAELKAGADGKDLFARSCEPYIEAGQPTQLTKTPGEVLADGYFHSLGHGIGLEVHERPHLGRMSEPLLDGDVITVEPGCYRRGFGGCRLEDLVVVTASGYEILTDFPYEL
jgi:Xaa-Pro aminopeptidase